MNNTTEFFSGLKNDLSLENHDVLHYAIVKIVNEDDDRHSNLIKFMLEFEKFDWGDNRGYMRTFLVAIKPIVNRNNLVKEIHIRMATEFLRTSKSKA